MRVERRYSGGLSETWANRRCLGAAGAQEPRIAVSKHSYNMLSAERAKQSHDSNHVGRVHERQQSQ